MVAGICIFQFYGDFVLGSKTRITIFTSTVGAIHIMSALYFSFVPEVSLINSDSHIPSDMLQKRSEEGRHVRPFLCAGSGIFFIRSKGQMFLSLAGAQGMRE